MKTKTVITITRRDLVALVRDKMGIQVDGTTEFFVSDHDERVSIVISDTNGITVALGDEEK